MVNTLGLQPNAGSIALLVRALGHLRKPLQAEAVWKEWRVCLVQTQSSLNSAAARPSNSLKVL